MYQLYGHPESEYTQRVAMFLQGVGCHFEFESVDLKKISCLDGVVEPLFETQLVPVLKEIKTGFYLAESLAICRFLWSKMRLEQSLSGDLNCQARLESLVDFCQHQILSPLNEVVWFRYWLPKLQPTFSKNDKQIWTTLSGRSVRKVNRYLSVFNHLLASEPDLLQGLNFVTLSLYAPLRTLRTVPEDVKAQALVEQLIDSPVLVELFTKSQKVCSNKKPDGRSCSSFL